MNYKILEHAPLFHGIDENSRETLLKCLHARTVSYKKEEILLMAGDKPEHIGIVMDGQLNIVKEDYDGNRIIVTTLATGDLFAEALCCAEIQESPVTVVANENCSVLSLDFSRILQTCTSACPFHSKLIANMLKLIARKNLTLQNRMEIIAMKSIRQKVLRYLESLAINQGKHIAVPFNREKMAEFLNVDRSALSHELIKMKKDGIIDYKRNIFILL